MNVGFIGAGNMATAMIRGIRSHGFSSEEVFAFDIDSQKLQDLQESVGIQIAQDARNLIISSDVVILAVKPQMLGEALQSLPECFEQQDPLIISIAAGTPLLKLEQLCGEGRRIIRVMPNLNATVGEAMSAYCGNEAVQSKDFEIAATILESFGKAVMLEEEKFAAYSALAGCSPAYTMLYMDALAKAGEQYGISRDVALKVVAQAVLGTAKLLDASGEETDVWIKRVCSPGGTTIEGIRSLENNDVRQLIIEAAEASIHRDEELQKG